MNKFWPIIFQDMSLIRFIKYGFILILSFKASALTILLDPGHGGKELGAVAKDEKNQNIYEKELTLKLAKLIQKKLSPTHSVFLTRSIDRTVDLAERAAIADKVNADLFISIHFNSSEINKYHGFETYYLDNHDDAAVKKLENLENNIFATSDEIINKILIDLVVNKTVTQSKKLSDKIHRRIAQYVRKPYHMKDRGIKAGLFHVLALSKRPGVLLEVGFLSNKNEAQKISTQQFLDTYANSVANGVNDFTAHNNSIASIPLL